MDNRRRDVVVMGGGLAGLALSVQLKRANPEIDVLVAERSEHPPPLAAHKVGESTLEAQAHYLSKVLGLKDYLEEHQLRKSGLRFFFSDGKNDDITRRVEFGPTYQLRWPSYQLDRGTLEGKLGEYATELGVEFLDQTTVRDVTVGDGNHTVRLKREGVETDIECRYLVDATGRLQFLKRKLDLDKPVHHKANAAWFRIPTRIEPGQWSDDPEWQGRMNPFEFEDGQQGEMRYLSTNHLCGHGYWLWFIPLHGDITSVGIVVDDNIFPIGDINKLDKAMEWMKKHEPQAYEAVAPHLDEVLDFKFLRRYSHNCERVYSPQKWFITGIAGAFHDPLFSYGGDMIGYSNSFVTDMITRDYAGEDVTARTELYNHIFLNQVVDTVFSVFDDKYPLFGNPQLQSLSIHWTTSWYWTVPANLFLHDKLTDLEFLTSVTDEIDRAAKLMKVVQTFFVDWYKYARNADHADYLIPYCCHEWIRRLHNELHIDLDNDGLAEKFRRDLANLEDLAREIFWMGVRVLPDPPERQPINPYVISLDPERWEADGLFDASAQDSSDPVDWNAELSDYYWFDGAEGRAAEETGVGT